MFFSLLVGAMMPASMAIVILTFTLVQATAYRQRYLVTSTLSGSQSLLNSTLAADLAAAPGPLRQIVNAGVNGIGTVPAGGLTQAQSRAILQSDATASVGNNKVPRAVSKICSRTGGAVWSVDAEVDGSGNPQLVITTDTGGGATAYLDIDARHSIDF